MNKEDLEVRKFIKLIDKTKKKLINKLLDKGLYENFGQAEISKLKSQVNIYANKYNEKEYKKYMAWDSFRNWCENLNDRDIRNLKGR